MGAVQKGKSLIVKNKKTGQREQIQQRELEHKDWGFSFFCDGEVEAYKAAYIYRLSEHGVIVEYAKGAGRWMVTVFNARAAELELDGAV